MILRTISKKIPESKINIQGVPLLNVIYWRADKNILYLYGTKHQKTQVRLLFVLFAISSSSVEFFL